MVQNEVLQKFHFYFEHLSCNQIMKWRNTAKLNFSWNFLISFCKKIVQKPYLSGLSIKRKKDYNDFHQKWKFHGKK